LPEPAAARWASEPPSNVESMEPLYTVAVLPVSSVRVALFFTSPPLPVPRAVAAPADSVRSPFETVQLPVVVRLPESVVRRTLPVEFTPETVKAVAAVMVASAALPTESRLNELPLLVSASEPLPALSVVAPLTFNVPLCVMPLAARFREPLSVDVPMFSDEPLASVASPAVNAIASENVLPLLPSVMALLPASSAVVPVTLRAPV